MQTEINPSQRRNFLKWSALTIGSILTDPLGSGSQPLYKKQSNLHFTPDETFWESIQGQFAIPKQLVMANSANLCSPPYAVIERVNQFNLKMSRDVSFQSRAVFPELREEALNRISNYLGVGADEVGITRNTTEANNIIINGLDLSEEDEVIVWDQNHPSNRESWENRARREGFTVKRISVPKNPASKEDLLKAVVESFSKDTRVLAFSHISNVSGIALPAEEICKAARKKGILTVIDGAQSCGFLNIDLKKTGCDFYTSSTHKWMMGPFENGLLYVNREILPQVWPDRITVFWKEGNDTVDSKLCALGQRNESTTPAIIDVIDFHESIGKQVIEDRIRDMAKYLKDQLKQNIPGIEFVTPLSPDLSGGVTIFKLRDKDPREVFDKLYHEYGVACAPTGGIRLSPTISATMKDMDHIVFSVKALTA